MLTKDILLYIGHILSRTDVYTYHRYRLTCKLCNTLPLLMNKRCNTDLTKRRPKLKEFFLDVLGYNSVEYTPRFFDIDEYIVSRYYHKAIERSIREERDIEVFWPSKEFYYECLEHGLKPHMKAQYDRYYTMLVSGRIKLI